jgi:hypothetical protein
MPAPSTAAAAAILLLVALALLASNASAFLLPAASQPKAATRLNAHNHLQTALLLMQQNQQPGPVGGMSNSRSSRAGRGGEICFDK